MMPEKMIKLLKIIEDSLWCNEERDNIVVIPEDNFIKNGLSIEDVKIGLQALIDEKIIENCYIEDRIRHACPTSYEEKIEYIKDSIPLSGIFSKEVLGTPLYFITIKNKNKLTKIIKQLEHASTEENKKLEFDSHTGVITYGKDKYRIESKSRLAVFRKLWEQRKETRKNPNGQEIIIHKGMAWLKNELSNNIEIEQKAILTAIKGLNRIFKKKDFPLEIQLAKGVQLIIEL